MTIASIDDLPNSIKVYLPVPAQQMYRIAYNNALKRYNDKHSSNTETAKRKFAERVAWQTIQYRYERVI